MNSYFSQEKLCVNECNPSVGISNSTLRFSIPIVCALHRPHIHGSLENNAIKIRIVCDYKQSILRDTALIATILSNIYP